MEHAVGDQKCAGELVHNHDAERRAFAGGFAIRPVFSRKEAFAGET